MRRKADGPGTFELLARLPQQIIALIRAEYENAKKEIKAAIKRFSIGAVFLVIALFFLFWAIAAFVFSAIAAIHIKLPLWASGLIVGGGLLLLTAAAIFVGIYLIRRGNPVPEETLERLSDDVLVAQGVRYNQAQNVAAERLDGEDSR